jgi:hypothetical protein
VRVVIVVEGLRMWGHFALCGPLLDLRLNPLTRVTRRTVAVHQGVKMAIRDRELHAVHLSREAGETVDNLQ